MSRTIILTGAPETKNLDWSEKTLLQQIVNKEAAHLLPLQAIAQSAEAFSAQWRQVSTEKLQMRPILPQLNIDARSKKETNDSPADFFTPTELLSQTPISDRDSSNDSYVSAKYSEDTASEALSEFYNHSFTIHEALPSSQFSDFSEVTPGTPTYESNEETFPQTPSSTGGIIRVASKRRLSQVPRPKQLSDLEDIPNADYLRSVEPSTITVNLIVAILSISEPKTVTTGARYGKPRPTELVELLVADETKTGFSITVWLPREMHVNWKDGVKATPEGHRSLLRRDIKGLRPRDIVVLQNVALSSFQGKVHGQSLKNDVTKVSLLFRRKLDDEDVPGVYTPGALKKATDSDRQLLKVKRVRDWMLAFVGDQKGSLSKRGGRRELPPDTQ